MGKNNGGHKAWPRETTLARRIRRLLDSAGAVKLFARQTELMSATLAQAVAIFYSRKKSAENRKFYEGRRPEVEFRLHEEVKAKCDSV